MEKQKNEKFECWAIVELFGHNRLAGKVTEQTIGGCSFLRVDVPATPALHHNWGDQPAIPAFTKFLTQGAIYAMTPCTEDAAYKALEEFRTRPVTQFDLARPSQGKALPYTSEDEEDDDREF